jgi:branched-chain amino acid transport system substrate-binding protein
MLNGFDACGGRPGRRPTISLALRLIAATTFLVGCAASDDGGVIRLGVAGPMKEPSGKGMYQGALLAVEEINARGGVRGRPLELVVRDDEMNSVRAIEVAEEFRDRTDVVAVVGHLSSGASIAASEIYNEPGNGLLAISPGATSPEMSTTGEWTFRVCPSDLQQAAALAEWAFNGLGRRRTLIVYVNDAYGRGVRDAFTPAFERLGGTVVSADPYLPDLLEDERTLDPYLERGIRNGMDALVLVGMGDEVTAILRAARRLGFRGTVMGTDGLIGIAEAGSVAEDVVVTSGFLVDRATESARDFVQRYQARFGELPRDGSAHAYDTVMLLAHAIDRVGTDRKAVRDYVASIGDGAPAFEGVTGTIRFDPNGDAVGKDVIIGVVRDGRVVTVGEAH